MSHWNYRVISKTVIHPDGVAEEYGIHSVFYNDDGEPEVISVEPMVPYGDTYYELKADLELMSKAFRQPPMKYEDFGKENDND
jgi:hypothetical protein